MFMDFLGNDPKPKYANDVQVSHNAIETSIRFRFISGMNVDTHTEIVMHPMILKAALQLLQKELEAFEKEHGIIYLPTDASGLEGLFGGQIGEKNV